MKILVVGPSWVGDSVMAQALYKRIKQEEPSAKIEVIAPEWSLSLLDSCLLYTSPSPRDRTRSRMPSSA